MFAATRSVPQASDNLAKTDHDLFMQFSAIWPGVYIGLRVYTLGLLITCTHEQSTNHISLIKQA